MKKPQFTMLAATAAACFATPVMAQSDEKPWQGGYVGVSVGVGAQRNDGNEIVEFDTNMDGTYGDTVRTTSGADAFSPGFCGGAANGRTPDQGCRSDKDGKEFYARGGYDFQNGNLVYGVVVDAGTSRSRDSVSAFSTTPAFYTFTRELDYSAGARLRAGYTPGGVLFYATGGVAYGRIDNSFLTSNSANSFNGNMFADSKKTSSWGYSAGGGAEAKITKNLTLGLEYLHTNYMSDDYFVLVGPGTAPATNPFRIVNPNGTNMRRSDRDFDMHNIRVTAAYRF